MDYNVSITDLPPEILLQFFVTYAQDEPVPVPWDFQQSPLAIVHVCSYWRHLAINEPNVWRNLLFAFNVNNPHFVDMIQETLVRSCGLPLSLHIHGERSPSWMENFTDCMLPIWDRLTGFDIVWRRESGWTPPQVTSLYLEISIVFPLKGCLPNLTDLVLDGISISLEGLFGLLRGATSLQKLLFHPKNEEGYAESFPQNLVNLPNLTHLSMRINDSQTKDRISLIFDCILAPRLTHMALVQTFVPNTLLPQWWPHGLEHRISRFDTLISLRIDYEIPAITLRHIQSVMYNLQELVVPWVRTKDIWDSTILLRRGLTRVVINATKHLDSFLSVLESICARRLTKSVQFPCILRDVVLVWDEPEEMSYDCVEELLQRAYRVDDSRMKVRIVNSYFIDPDVDLRTYV